MVNLERTNGLMDNEGAGGNEDLQIATGQDYTVESLPLTDQEGVVAAFKSIRLEGFPNQWGNWIQVKKTNTEYVYQVGNTHYVKIYTACMLQPGETVSDRALYAATEQQKHLKLIGRYEEAEQIQTLYDTDRAEYAVVMPNLGRPFHTVVQEWWQEGYPKDACPIDLDQLHSVYEALLQSRHGDAFPENLVVDAQGRIAAIDFELEKADRAPITQTMDMAYTMIHTPYDALPEQFRHSYTRKEWDYAINRDKANAVLTAICSAADTARFPEVLRTMEIHTAVFHPEGIYLLVGDNESFLVLQGEQLHFDSSENSVIHNRLNQLGVVIDAVTPTTSVGEANSFVTAAHIDHPLSEEELQTMQATFPSVFPVSGACTRYLIQANAENKIDESDPSGEDAQSAGFAPAASCN